MSTWESQREKTRVLYYATQQELRQMGDWINRARDALATPPIPKVEHLKFQLKLRLDSMMVQKRTLEADLHGFRSEYPELAAEFDAEERKNK